MREKGIAGIYLTLLVLAASFAIATSISVLTYSEQKISQNIVNSSQAYYAAESGLEDIIYRIEKGLPWPNLYDLQVSDSSTTVSVSNIVGGVRTITSNGNKYDRNRKLQIIYEISAQEISFYYGAQVGDGGMEMDNNTWVRGNVFSNGTVISKVTGAGSIEDNVVVAGNGNKIVGLNVGKDALVHTCENSTIGGSLTYISGGGIQNCTFGETLKESPNEILPKDLPISQAQIDQWKTDAQKGGTITGDYEIPINITENIGPVRITGNLTLNNGSVLNMLGTIWVEGNIVINNGSTAKLDSTYYGSNSGMLIADGKIEVWPGTVLLGTEQDGSYLLLLSTNPSLDIDNPAINIENNTTATIFFATQGLITLSNNIQVREVTGYKIYLKNNTEVIYESGLENAAFSSGTGGGWEVASWKEIE